MDDLVLSIDPRGDSEIDFARKGTEKREPKLRFFEGISAISEERLCQWMA